MTELAHLPSLCYVWLFHEVRLIYCGIVSLALAGSKILKRRRQPGKLSIPISRDHGRQGQDASKVTSHESQLAGVQITRRHQSVADLLNIQSHKKRTRPPDRQHFNPVYLVSDILF